MTTEKMGTASIVDMKNTENEFMRVIKYTVDRRAPNGNLISTLGIFDDYESASQLVADIENNADLGIYEVYDSRVAADSAEIKTDRDLIDFFLNNFTEAQKQQVMALLDAYKVPYKAMNISSAAKHVMGLKTQIQMIAGFDVTALNGKVD